MTTTSSPPPPGRSVRAGTPPAGQDAAGIMADLTRPLARYAGSNLSDVVQIAGAAVMTAAGAGLRLAGSPGVVAMAVSVGCAVLVTVRVVVPLAVRQMPGYRREPPWAPAARALEQSMPDRVPAATLAVVRKYGPLITAARRRAEVFVYVAPCAGPDEHTILCRAAAIWRPGGRLMVILGEHAADDPAVTAASLGHEFGHVSGGTYWAFALVHGARQAGGWGWAAAGFIGSAWGWPGVLTAAAIFWAVSMLAAWTVEVACDRRAARAEGQSVARAGFRYMAAAMAADRTSSAVRHAAAVALSWAAGPSHPPLRLRRRLATPLRWSPWRHTEAQAGDQDAGTREPGR